MLQSVITNMSSINKEINMSIPVSVHAVPKDYGEIKSLTIDAFANASPFVKNPAYKNINSSQIIISKTIEINK